jgi:hypothetical protein
MGSKTVYSRRILKEAQQVLTSVEDPDPNPDPPDPSSSFKNSKKNLETIL